MMSTPTNVLKKIAADRAKKASDHERKCAEAVDYGFVLAMRDCPAIKTAEQFNACYDLAMEALAAQSKKA